MIEFPLTPITEETFERQNWEMVVEKEESGDYNESEEFYYFRLPLPNDNPDLKSPNLISSCNDDYADLNIKKGEYFVEVENLYGLGLCTSEEELEILYRALTKSEIELK